MENYIESSKFIKLNFPDPHGFGDIYKPVFPPRHRTVKAILDNLPNTVEKVYIFGSSVRTDCSPASDLDVFFIGSITNDDYCRIMRAVPEDEKVDLLTETKEEFMKNLESGKTSLYQKVYEKGYKIYEKEKTDETDGL